MIRKAAATVIALCLSASPLHAQNAPSTKPIVNEASATVHKTPSVASPVIGTAPRGTELVVTREVGDWVKIAWPSAADGVGYVRKSALAQVAVTSAIAKAPAAAPTSVSSKAAVTPAASVAPVAVREQIPVSQPRVPQAGTHYVAPTHIFGVGAVTGSSRGFGGSARGWKAGRLGVLLHGFAHVLELVLSRFGLFKAPGVRDAAVEARPSWSRQDQSELQLVRAV